MKKCVSLIFILLLCCGCESNANDNKEFDLSKTKEALEKASEYFENEQKEIERENNIIDEAKQKWETAKKNLNDTQEETNDLTDGLEYLSDKQRQDILESISSKYDELSEMTKLENQANLNYQIALAQTYGNSDTSSLESLSQMQLEKDLKYIESSKKLAEELCSGKIDYTQYEKSINDLNITFGYATIP